MAQHKCRKCGYEMPEYLRKLQDEGVIGELFCDTEGFVREMTEQERLNEHGKGITEILRRIGNSEVAQKLRRFLTESLHDTKYEHGHCVHCKNLVLHGLCIICGNKSDNNFGLCHKCYIFMYRKLGYLDWIV